MEESVQQRELSKPGEKHHTPLLMVFGIFACVYLFFPAIFLYPVFLVYHNNPRPPRVEKGLRMFFYPVDQLYTTIPAYKQVVDWEIQMLGMY